MNHSAVTTMNHSAVTTMNHGAVTTMNHSAVTTMNQIQYLPPSRKVCSARLCNVQGAFVEYIGLFCRICRALLYNIWGSFADRALFKNVQGGGSRSKSDSVLSPQLQGV